MFIECPQCHILNYDTEIELCTYCHYDGRTNKLRFSDGTPVEIYEQDERMLKDELSR